MIFKGNDIKEVLSQSTRIGILGGAFDPIHYGHLTAAECVRCKYNLDIILFVPTGTPPHKNNVSFSEHRYLMTLLATEDNPYFYTTRMELDKPGISYTVDTLRDLKLKTKAELFFIIGADEMQQISTWKDAHLLESLCNWITVTRPGYQPVSEAKNLITIPGLDISSTELRRRIKSGEPVKYLIPSKVETYIKELDVYNCLAKKTDEKTIEEIHKAVSAKLSKKRYNHTLGVVETALLLSIKHGENLRSAYLAALLHDYAKELSEKEKRDLCNKFKIPLDEIQSRHINLMHGALSAELAKIEFNIKEPKVLDAITNHTTGRVGMKVLEQIIKIADNIEPNRPNYPGINKIKELAETNLQKAAAASIRRDIQYTEAKGHELHPLGIKALKDLEE